MKQGLSHLALHRDLSSRVLRLAYPVVLGSLSVTLLSVVDTIFVGRLGAAPLAASGIAGVLYFAIVFPLAAIGVGVQTLTARRFGEGNYSQCGEITRNGLILAALLGLPLIVSAPWLARWTAPLLSSDPEVRRLGTIYLQYRTYGAVFMFLNWTFRAFFAGIGETRHQMIGSIIVTVANLVLDLLLIFGYAGFPRMGIQGAALASTLALACGTVYFGTVYLLPRYRSRFSPRGAAPSGRRWMKPIVRLSLPIVGQRILSNGSWFAFFAIVSRIGTIELAATNIIRSVYGLTIMLAVGMGTAAAALVGQNLGAKRPDDAEKLAWESAKLAAYVMGILGLLFLFAPGWVLRVYTSDAAVIAAGRMPTFYLGFVQIFAGVSLVLSQSLQGAGNTRFVMMVELVVCLGLYLPTVYLLGIHARLGLLGAWTGEYIYWIFLAAIMTLRFRRGKWKSIEV